MNETVKYQGTPVSYTAARPCKIDSGITAFAISAVTSVIHPKEPYTGDVRLEILTEDGSACSVWMRKEVANEMAKQLGNAADLAEYGFLRDTKGFPG